MSTEKEPIEAIHSWQEWFRQHQVADNPPTFVKSEVKARYLQKAQDHFADTIAEFQYELNGFELYKAFYAAAMENMEGAKKEYNKAKQLVDCLKGLD